MSWWEEREERKEEMVWWGDETVSKAELIRVLMGVSS